MSPNARISLTNRVISFLKCTAMTENIVIPEFEQVAQALSRVGSLNNPAEAHGMLCGMLCADEITDGHVWNHDPYRLH